MRKTSLLLLVSSFLSPSLFSAPVTLIATGGGYGGNSTESGNFDLDVASDSLLIASVITRTDNGSSGITIGGTDSMTQIGVETALGGRGSIYYYALALGDVASLQSNVSFAVASSNASTYFYQVAGASQDLGTIVFGSQAGGGDTGALSLSLDTGAFATVGDGSYLFTAAAHGKDDSTINLTFGGSDVLSFDQGPTGGVSDTYLGWASTGDVTGSVSVTADFTFSSAGNDARGAALAAIVVTAVPEPGTAVLVALAGSVAFLMVCRRRC